MTKILITENIDPVGPELLRKHGAEVIMADRDPSAIAKEIIDADAIIVRIIDLTPELLGTAKKLKMVSKHGVGYDNIPVSWCKDHGIAVTIAPGANSQSVAEHTIALMMSLAKNITIVTKKYREEGFSAKNSSPGMEILDKTMGIIGVGHIGSRVAKMAFGLGMKVVAYDPYVKSVPEGVELLEDKDEVIKRADVLTLHPVLNEETRHMIGARELGLMKPTSYFINCGRGPLVDEEALIDALKNHKIAGAGLDVTQEEPCRPDNPLFTMSNVLLTPHYAPTTVDCAKRVSTVCCQNALDVLAGKKPEGLL